MSKKKGWILYLSAVAFLFIVFLAVLFLSLPIGKKLLPITALLAAGISIGSVFLLSSLTFLLWMKRGS